VRILLIVVVVLALALISASSIAPFVLGMKFDKDAIAQSGQFGDSFGLLNAISSLLAFVGVAIAVYLQRIEIHDNRKAQAGQLEIARKSAVIQSLTFQAQLYLDLMRGATTATLAEQYRRSADACTECVIGLLSALGQQPVTTPIVSKQLEAANQLDEIVAILNDIPPYESVTRAEELYGVLGDAVERLKRWKAEYDPSDVSGIVTQVINRLSAPGKSGKKSDFHRPDWDDVVKDIDARRAFAQEQLPAVAWQLRGQV
jgi:hypothetical protein